VTEIGVRQARLADLPVLAAIFRRASLSNVGDREHLRVRPEFLVFGGREVEQRLADNQTWAAEVHGTVIGFATLLGQGPSRELEDLFVDPSWMRRGVATRLIQEVVRHARLTGAREIQVTANEHALPFYTATGFVDIGTAPTTFGTSPRLHFVLDPTPKR
jgi:GNAT superfamily N-acetyltransferase